MFSLSLSKIKVRLHFMGLYSRVRESPQPHRQVWEIPGVQVPLFDPAPGRRTCNGEKGSGS